MQSDILSYGPPYNKKPTITVKSIFTDNNNWYAFQLSEKANLREVEIKEVTKMMTCKDADRGFFTYYCENCGTVTTVHFGCNSRICTNCGKNHTDKWAKSLSKALFNVKIPNKNQPIVTQKTPNPCPPLTPRTNPAVARDPRADLTFAQKTRSSSNTCKKCR